MVLESLARRLRCCCCCWRGWCTSSSTCRCSSGSGVPCAAALRLHAWTVTCTPFKGATSWDGRSPTLHCWLHWEAASAVAAGPASTISHKASSATPIMLTCVAVLVSPCPPAPPPPAGSDSHPSPCAAEGYAPPPHHPAAAAAAAVPAASSARHAAATAWCVCCCHHHHYQNCGCRLRHCLIHPGPRCCCPPAGQRLNSHCRCCQVLRHCLCRQASPAKMTKQRIITLLRRAGRIRSRPRLDLERPLNECTVLS